MLDAYMDINFDQKIKMVLQTILSVLKLADDPVEQVKLTLDLAIKCDAKVEFLFDLSKKQDSNNQAENRALDFLRPYLNAFDFENFELNFALGTFESELEKIAKEKAFDLILLAFPEVSSVFKISILRYQAIVDNSELPILLVPHNYVFTECQHFMFNIKFEFYEIDGIYDLLELANELDGLVTCWHSAKKIEKEHKKNLNTYELLFEYQIERQEIDFILFQTSLPINEMLSYAKKNEVNVLVMLKSRKSWIPFVSTNEQNVIRESHLPLLILNR